MSEILAFLLLVALIVIAVLIFQSRTRAQKQYDAWRERDLESLRSEQSAIAHREAMTQLQAWKIESEGAIRQNAIARSQAVITGKVSEQLVPYMSVFPYNPKDARFVGSPIDLIVFDGLDEGIVQEVVFLEVKTGASSLNQRQKQIRDAVLAGRVVWRELRIKQ